MDYLDKVVYLTALSATELEAKVNKAIKEHFKLSGNLVVISTLDEPNRLVKNFYVQCMINKDISDAD